MADELLDLAKDAFTHLSPAARVLLKEVACGGVADFTTAAKDECVLSAEVLVWLCSDPKAAAYVTHRGIAIKGVQVEGVLNLASVVVSFPVAFEKCQFLREIRLRRAKIPMLTLDGSQTREIEASGLEVEGYVLLRNDFYATGKVRFYGARIRGNLECSRGTFFNAKDVALDLENIRVEGSIRLGDGFRAHGEVRLVNAVIGGALVCTDGIFAKVGATAMVCDSARIDGGIFLSRSRKEAGDEGSKGFVAHGQVSLIGVTIGGDLDCGGGLFIEPRVEPLPHATKAAISLDASRAKIGRAIFLRDGFRATGQVRLTGATVGGDVNCNRGQFITPSAKAVHGNGLTVGGGVFFHNTTVDGDVGLFTAKIGGAFVWENVQAKSTTLDLRLAKIGTLGIDQRAFEASPVLHLGGLVYEGLTDAGAVDVQTRLQWLKRVEPQTDPEGLGTGKPQRQRPVMAQPYEQLAAVLQKLGYPDDAKDILIAKEQARGRTQRLFSPGWWWYRLFAPLIGYGYRPARAFVAAVVIMVLGAFIFDYGARRGLMQTTTEKQAVAPDRSTAPQPTASPLRPFYPTVYSFDAFVPVLNLQQGDYWLPNADAGAVRSFWRWQVRDGALLWGYLWFHIIAGWVLTTLWVTALTGLVRK